MIIMGKEVAKIYAMPSSSGSKTYQTVQYVDGSTSCDCMGWTRRVQPDGSRTCKHIRFVDMGIADREAVSSQNFATPAPVQTVTHLSITITPKITSVDKD
jgi:hypothetical protein